MSGIRETQRRAMAMRRMRVGERALLGLVLGVMCTGVLGVFFVRDAHTSEQSPSNSAANTERISPSQVTLSNLKAFEEQVKRDLPQGTPKAEVETYLTKWNIRHSFVPSSDFYGPSGNAFYATLDNIGMRNIFRASLAIRIFLDDEKVREIVFRVDYL